MDTISYKDYFENELILLQFIGSLWFSNGLSRKRKILQRTLFILTQLLFSGFVVAIAWYGSFSENYSITITCMMLISPILGVAGILKGFFLLKDNWRFQKLYETIIYDYEKPRTPEENKIITDNLKFYKTVKQLLLTSCVMSITATVLIPIEQNQYLPFPYPVDVSDSPYFELAYIQEVIAFFILVTVYIFPEILMLGCTTFVGLQYDLICYNLIHLQDIRDLKGIIKEHLDLLNIVKIVQEIFSQLYLVHFATSTIILVMGLFIIIQSTSYNAEYFVSMSYIICVFGLLLFPSWCSSEMSRKIDQLPNAAYACAWVDAPTAIKRDLLYLMHMSQNSIELKAIGLFPISLETFESIVRTSFSYYAVLKNLYSQQQ